MKSNIKSVILENSRSLFNKNGYASVSMRDISNACQISVGNLTYHFPHKTDILCALMEDIQPSSSTTIQNFQDLYQYLKEMILGVKKNAFFFSVNNMQHLDETCFLASKANVDKLRDSLIIALKNFRTNGLLSSSLTDNSITSIVSFWMLSHLSWASEDNQESIYKQTTLDEFLTKHFDLLIPYFTPKAAKEFKQLSK